MTPLTICILFASLNSLNLGYDVGTSSGLQVLLRSDPLLHLNDSEMELYLGLLNFSSLIGCIIQPAISDKFGRLKVFVLSSFLFMSGLIAQVLASSYSSLVLGRVLVGVGVGVGLSIDPVYISECSPKESRGTKVRKVYSRKKQERKSKSQRNPFAPPPPPPPRTPGGGVHHHGRPHG